MKIHHPCQNCGSSGKRSDGKKCHYCGGAGEIIETVPEPKPDPKKKAEE